MNQDYKQSTAAEQLVTERLLERIYLIHSMLDQLLYEPERDHVERELIEAAQAPLVLLGRLLRGSEPAWMQDVRAAQSALEAARVASRNQRPDPSSGSSD